MEFLSLNNFSYHYVVGSKGYNFGFTPVNLNYRRRGRGACLKKESIKSMQWDKLDFGSYQRGFPEMTTLYVGFPIYKLHTFDCTILNFSVFFNFHICKARLRELHLTIM